MSDSLRLLIRGTGNFSDEVRYFTNARDDFLQRTCGFLGELAAVFYVRDGILNQLRGLLGRLRAPEREVSDLLRHHGKSLSVDTGSRCLNRCV